MVGACGEDAKGEETRESKIKASLSRAPKRLKLRVRVQGSIPDANEGLQFLLCSISYSPRPTLASIVDRLRFGLLSRSRFLFANEKASSSTYNYEQ